LVAGSRNGLGSFEKFDVVMAWSVDRLGRSLRDLVGFLNEIHALKIDLYLHQQGIDTATPAGKAMFQMMGVSAEFERAMIQERVGAGLARAKDERKTLGRRLSVPRYRRATRACTRSPPVSVSAPARCSASRQRWRHRCLKIASLTLSKDVNMKKRFGGETLSRFVAPMAHYWLRQKRLSCLSHPHFAPTNPKRCTAL
jgi:DNA invertase Pin-like site-specific DNA recombinase